MHLRHRILAKILAKLLAAALVSGMTGCTLGPDYERPGAPVPATYKEVKGWKIAAPSDHFDRGAWWSIYRDATLDALESEVVISNQTLAAAEAAYRQAAAMVQQARAALFPTVGLLYNPVRSHLGGGASGTGRSITTTRVALETTGSWDVDVWGKVRRLVESNADLAQASAADVAGARL